MVRTAAGVAIVIGLASATVEANVVVGWGTDAWGATVAQAQAAGGTPYTLRWRNPAGGTTTTTHTGTGLTQSFVPPAGFGGQGSRVEVVGKVGATSTLASLTWHDPGAYAVASHSVTGGTITAGGETFNLSGSFEVRGDTFDLDPVSPTYGQLNGRLLSQSAVVVGQAPSGQTLQLVLDADAAFSTSLASALNQPGVDGETSTWMVSVSGTAVFSGGVTFPFTGSASGTTTYFPSLGNSNETYDVALSLSTPMGPLSGQLLSSGTVSLVPAPGALGVIGLGMSVAARRRRTRC
jgi:MYXO-CTERM domain-containing protein